MGYKILNHHLMLILLIQLFLWATIINGQFIPGPRSGHTATLIGDKIYFIGGYNFSISPKESDVFYYDGKQLVWVEVNNNRVNGQGADMPLKFGHTANVGGRNQDLIFIIGGDQFSTVYQLDTKTNKITLPTILGVFPSRDSLSFMSSVSYEGKFIFGSLVGAPPPRYKHTATLVNEIIYYIGGIQLNNSYVSYTTMSDIFRYSTKSNTWSSVVATLAPGNFPGRRAGHSAILAEGKICIFGGIFNESFPAVTIAMLDTNTLEWSRPPFKNPRRPYIPLPRLVYHTATLIDNRMFVAFGNDTDNGSSGYEGLHHDFFIFDFNNNEWYITTADELTNPSAHYLLLVALPVVQEYHRIDQQLLPQGNLDQEDSILPIPSNSDRFSNRSSNYHPRSETNSHSQRSEAQTQHVYTMLM
ncbi:unnamed protein product [Rhizophagus irregularis]|uniref:Galactose oxidase n=1 Tax=Rhizophagus irregularis TaxID=588596 RepID=A0A2N1N2J8_9GLOM|nr:galactose oxidase [Rhizophagus irregularis]CAB5393951.1 unnamed protein product [Rhizophagus irregularis]